MPGDPLWEITNRFQALAGADAPPLFGEWRRLATAAAGARSARRAAASARLHPGLPHPRPRRLLRPRGRRRRRTADAPHRWYRNSQTGGVTAHYYGKDGGTVTSVGPGGSSNSYNWSPIRSLKNC
ncbi:hypothetical protein [Streptomyces canus]|uniref:hypothetical protein n=1 Tax=Streptomyces canus TaxID=58343 RepID=UPI0030E0D08A